jgi:superfamily II RNA helicase
VNADLQEDFSLNHALSLWLLETIPLVQADSETYALDVLTLVESILEDPDLVLIRQLDKLKDEKMAEMKAAGMEYEERIAELEKLEYPKPNRDFVYDTFNSFAKKHPWVGTESIRPKSIARDMVEKYLSFPEYVREYGLERGEGLLLRYLSDVYKTLVQNVPSAAKTAEVEDLVTYFGAIVRAVDSSLLDEWERLRAPEDAPKHQAAAPELPGEADVTANAKELTVLVRNAMFGVLRALARRDYATAAALVDPSSEWKADRFEAAMAPFWAEHAAIRLDPRARSPENTRVEKGEGAWRVEQVVCDPEDANDWVIAARVDLARSREQARPVIVLERLGT